MRSVAGQKVFRSSTEGILSGFYFCFVGGMDAGWLVHQLGGVMMGDDRSETTMIDLNRSKGWCRA
ncbi:hypothetical protein [Porphyromonas cangingivalis]|uniref:hypothetical protein n=1 Tax=Porphyromonas cangingivalis TaxID=36874 RepID=UPI000AFE5D86|nr:hypothetical protein [Porphyromonas cangingivalis]